MSNLHHCVAPGYRVWKIEEKKNLKKKSLGRWRGGARRAEKSVGRPSKPAFRPSMGTPCPHAEPEAGVLMLNTRLFRTPCAAPPAVPKSDPPKNFFLQCFRTLYHGATQWCKFEIVTQKSSVDRERAPLARTCAYSCNKKCIKPTKV